MACLMTLLMFRTFSFRRYVHKVMFPSESLYLYYCFSSV